MSIARGPPHDALPEYQTMAWGTIQESKTPLSLSTNDSFPSSQNPLISTLSNIPLSQSSLSPPSSLSTRYFRSFLFPNTPTTGEIQSVRRTTRISIISACQRHNDTAGSEEGEGTFQLLVQFERAMKWRSGVWFISHRQALQGSPIRSVVQCCRLHQ
jgi:hypothetical protein